MVVELPSGGRDLGIRRVFELRAQNFAHRIAKLHQRTNPPTSFVRHIFEHRECRSGANCDCPFMQRERVLFHKVRRDDGCVALLRPADFEFAIHAAGQPVDCLK